MRRAGWLWTAALPAALLLLGAVLRLRQYAGGRSLWLDEAFLAESLVLRGPAQLVSEPLANSQSAPLGWLLAVRASVVAFGESEQALRLVPLLFGLAALPLVWLVARRLLPALAVPVAVLLVAVHPLLVTYSNELKPYSADVAAVLLVVLLALRGEPGVRDRRLWAVTVAGAVVVWFSKIALLVMAAVSVVLVVRALLRAGLPAALRTALVLAPWTVFGLAVVVLLTRLQRNQLLLDYWAPTFPRGLTDLPAWLVRRAQDLAVVPLEVTAPLLALVVVAIGVVRLARAQRGAAAVALAVVPAGVLVAAASAYPLADRLALWTVPLVALALAAALPERVTRLTAPWLVVVAVALAVVAGPLARDGVSASERSTLQQLEPVLRTVAAQLEPGDLVLVDRSARPAFDLYARSVPGLRRDAVVGLRTAPPACTDTAVLRELGVTSRRTWLVFSHQSASGPSRGARTEVPRRLAAVADLERTVEETGAVALLLVPRAQPGPEVVDDPTRCLVRVPA